MGMRIQQIKSISDIHDTPLLLNEWHELVFMNAETTKKSARYAAILFVNKLAIISPN